MVKIVCPRCGNIPDLPLHCNDCDAFYCSGCYDYHLIDYLPKFVVPKHIKERVERDLRKSIIENNKY